MEVSALRHPGSIPGLRGPSALLRLQSDERLIALTRRGHAAAFETLAARYQSRLLSFCRHMLGSKEDAEDVLQEVFAAAFNAIVADDRPINVRPWLYRIARNRSLNHLRRATATGVDSMDVHFAEQGLSTSDKVLRRESFRELIADVHELPETQRTALLLREIDALSYDQIAQAMETTVPSVKSLLVRARISLAEAAEARKLSCDEVRLELGEVAEGLTKLSPPARRHVRGCERCAAFKKQLRENNHALALIMPVAPLLLLKKVVLAKLGSTASAGGAHVAGGAGATMGAAGAAASGAVATGGGGFAGGLMTAGAGALATKAAATLAAAAIVTAGAVAADHAVVAPRHHPHALASSSNRAAAVAVAPVVVEEQAQPVSTGQPPFTSRAALVRRHAQRAARKTPVKVLPVAAATTPAAPTSAAAPTATPVTPTSSTTPPSGTQVTEVTSQTTQLPPEATSTTPTTTTTATPPPTSTTETSTTETSTTATPPPSSSGSPSKPTAEPVPVPETPPSGTGSSGGTPAP
jgi:RNA polymerase sigma factor (sigma-70 family)